MTGSALRRLGRDTRAPVVDAPPRAASAWLSSAEPALDQLLAEPIVQQLMRRDQTDEPAVRHLLRETAAARQPLPAKNTAPDACDPYTIVRLLHETARAWRGRYDREVRAQLPGMTRARCIVLTHLAQHEWVNQTALAQLLEVRPMTLIRLLNRLEAAGYVVRIVDPDDHRARVLALTAKALPVIERIYDLTRRICEDEEVGLSKAETSKLRALLCRIRSNLTSV
jgi:MarR family transcriptional regulator, transcriptional regulator for hemolysin